MTPKEFLKFCLDLWFVVFPLIFGVLLVMAYLPQVYPDAPWKLLEAMEDIRIWILFCSCITYLNLSLIWCIWKVFKCVKGVAWRVAWLALFYLITPISVPLFYFRIIRPAIN